MAKTHLDWLELTPYSANPADTDVAKRGICAVGANLRFWNGAQWVTVGLTEGMGLDSLSDVAIANVSDAQFLIYDNGSALWKNRSISGDIVIANTGVTTINNAVVNQAKLKYEVADVTVGAGNTQGTATVTSGSIVIGYYPTGNQDQFVDNISVAGTTLTITLANAATADNTFKVVLLKA